MHFEYVGYEKSFSGLSIGIGGININHILYYNLLKYLPLICVIVMNFLKLTYSIYRFTKATETSDDSKRSLL